MEPDHRDRLDQYIRDGFFPHDGPRSYVCGWRGRTVSSFVGLFKQEEWFSVDMIGLGGFLQNRRQTDIRVCAECWIATTFLDKEIQLPDPLKGDNLDQRKRTEDAPLIIALYNEARFALSPRAPSCGVLMFRKILMHIAVEQGAKAGLHFIQYVEYLKTNGIVGKPKHALLDRIKDEGNLESHEIHRASTEQAEDPLNLFTLLIRSVYFSS
ncbi:MAG: DUF4145 domain-containing protein [Planctomycetes bacterium]|nr:DUF4145 domain-containing protein [Planctomycetota bacterium]